MRTLYLFSLLISFSAKSFDNFQSMPLSYVRSDSVSLFSHENQKRLGANIVLEKKMGGDDIGNGGDDLRQKFIEISHQILAESLEHDPEQYSKQMLDQVKIKLTASKILVVDDLKVNEVKIPATITQGSILLDRSIWNTVNGVLSDKLDPRFEIFRLITEATGLSFKEEDLLRVYASLSFYTSPNTGEKIHATPWCLLKVSDEKLEKINETFTQTSEDNPEALKMSALENCQKEKNLKECRVVEMKRSGFAMWVSNKVVVQGSHYKTIKLTKEEQSKERCLELQRCSTLFELAPTGQVSSLGFSSLDEQINSSCH